MDKTNFEHNHDIICHGTCPETDCPENYVGETAQIISERVNDHTGKDVPSHFLNIQVKVDMKYYMLLTTVLLGKGIET